MKRTRIFPNLDEFPKSLRPLLESAPVYDSSCSPEARVYYIERDDGYYLKKASKGSLQNEVEMTRYFHAKGLAANVLLYESDFFDWLLTERVAGEDCTDRVYLEDPRRLCDTIATLLRSLHEIDPVNCPIPNHTGRYLQTVRENYQKGVFDSSLATADCSYQSAEEAWNTVSRHGHLLKCDTLLHGDYCLPNIMLDSWRHSGFIDLGNGGVGDRHVDLFWGAWTLCYNLKTDRYRERFFDAYGRDRIDFDLIRVVAAAECFG